MMTSGLTSDPALLAALGSIYEEVMWLAKRPNVTPGRARAWYTHVMAESVKRRVRRFSGYVSAKAAEGPTEPLMLEHYKRIQTTLSALVERHRTSGLHDPEEFIATLLDYEHVHIVTRSENYAAMRAKGNYEQAGIRLQSWQVLPAARRQALWTSMLKGKVANAGTYLYGDEA